jgi:hypothetical protein
MSSLFDALKKSAVGPRSASGDGQTTVEHSLPEQVLADKYVRSTRALQRGGPLAGARIGKLRAPGAVYPAGRGSRLDGGGGPRGL